MSTPARLFRRLAPFFTLLAAAGCAPVDTTDPSGTDPLDDSTATSRTAWYVLRADARRCAAPACGGYYVTEVNRATVVCANGRRERQCYVAAIDFGPSGLPATLADATRAAIGTDASAPSVLFYGTITAPAAGAAPYDTFAVQQAWRAPAPVALGDGDVMNVSTHGSSCTFIPCSDVKVAPLNPLSGAVTTVTGLDLTTAPGDALAHDQGLAASTTDPGVIAAGAVVQVPGNPATETVPAYRATQFFTRVARTPGRSCTATLQPIFTAAVNELLYTSESDAPYTFFARAGAGRMAETPAAFLALMGLPADTAVVDQPLDDFFAFASDDNAYSLADFAANARYRELERLIKSQLSDVHVYRVGSINLDVYIVGRDHCGNLVGYQTQSVET